MEQVEQVEVEDLDNPIIQPQVDLTKIEHPKVEQLILVGVEVLEHIVELMQLLEMAVQV
jgi:hypothetical protein